MAQRKSGALPNCLTFNATCIVVGEPQIIGYITPCGKAVRNIQFRVRLQHWTVMVHGFGEMVGAVDGIKLKAGDTIYLKGDITPPQSVVATDVRLQRRTPFRVNYNNRLVYFDSWDGKSTKGVQNGNIRRGDTEEEN